jgi:hypothetical protein
MQTDYFHCHAPHVILLIIFLTTSSLGRFATAPTPLLFLLPLFFLIVRNAESFIYIVAFFLSKIIFRFVIVCFSAIVFI